MEGEKQLDAYPNMKLEHKQAQTYWKSRIALCGAHL
jgi:hypothetical protein